VRDWEPSLAVYGGASGTAVYERLIPEAKRVLKPGGILALELGFGQSEAVSELVADWRKLQLFPDLAGIPRVLVCEKP
jgi:release factor glutamine methyltransferase